MGVLKATMFAGRRSDVMMLERDLFANSTSSEISFKIFRLALALPSSYISTAMTWIK